MTVISELVKSSAPKRDAGCCAVTSYNIGPPTGCYRATEIDPLDAISRTSSAACESDRSFTPRIPTRKYAAQIHKSATVSHATRDEFREKAFVAAETADGTISLVLLTAACISIVSSRLPFVRQ